MNTFRRIPIIYRFVLVLCLAASCAVAGETAKPDLSKDDKTLYLIATAHLDTQWNWTIQQTIENYLPATLRGNFALFDKFPDYTFNFEGAFRYMLAKEYYPEEYAKLKGYIAKGRWHVAGSSIDAGDVNVPSPESIFRQILYGNGFFKREFGKTSCDIFLPDCFGFGYALPSIAANCGLKGFSTQKLTWGSSVGIPFNVGVWEGVDGSSVVAALNPGRYSRGLTEDLSRSQEYLTRINKLGSKSGVYADYKYFGTGDRGGCSTDATAESMEKSVNGGGPVKVRNVSSDQLYRDLTPEQISKLPRYKGELLLTTHGTGCYTSEAAMKRWNRKNELLADAAERASAAADWLGGTAYPKDKLREAWTRFLWHQFHDDLTGTSTPHAYAFSWNDEIIAMNQFAEVLKNAVGAVSRGLDTRAQGVPVLVYNPLSFKRRDVVEAHVKFHGRAPQAVRVTGPDGKEVPSQVNSSGGDSAQILFLATMPPVGFAVYDVQPAKKPSPTPASLKVSESSLENDDYRVEIDSNGDVSRIYDKAMKRELLSAPVRLEMLAASPDNRYPAWEIPYRDVSAPPRSHVGGPARVRVVERGPVRVSLEITRQCEGSTFIQRIRLSEGEPGRRVEFENEVDWHTQRTLLKAAFPLTAKNKNATYDLGFGTISRGSNTTKEYEVPAQQWADLTDAGGDYGVAILNDCKYGWDKPRDNTLRLSLLYTPDGRSPHQILQDLGAHRFVYALCGHAGGWAEGDVVGQAAELNQPLLAFQTSAHPGKIGKSLSLVQVGSPNVVIRALKKAEDCDEIVVRLEETAGKSASAVRVGFTAGISAAREVNGSEEPLGPAKLESRKLILDFTPYQTRTFALKLDTAPARIEPPVCKPLTLPFNTDVVTFDANKADGDFDGSGHTLPAELLPTVIRSESASFTLGPTDRGKKNAVICKGQKITLNSGNYSRLYILASAAGGDVDGVFYVDGKAVNIQVQGFSGKIGQWYHRVVNNYQVDDQNRLLPPYIKRDPVAWVGTHTHSSDGQNLAYDFCYLFRYRIDLPKNAKTVKLPDNDRIRILAMTLARNTNDGITPTTPLVDEIVPAPSIKPLDYLFTDRMNVEILPAVQGDEVRYTTDGSDPTLSSPLYNGPICLTESATVKALEFRDGRQVGDQTAADFATTTLQAPQNPQNLVNGLDYNYYNGSRARSLSEDKPVKSGTVKDFVVTWGERTQLMAIIFTGFIDIPRDGIYTFHTKSAGNTKLYIDDVELTDCTLSQRTQQKDSGSIGLRAGRHPIRLNFRIGRTDADMLVSWEGPGIPLQPISADVLYRP